VHVPWIVSDVTQQLNWQYLGRSIAFLYSSVHRATQFRSLSLTGSFIFVGRRNNGSRSIADLRGEVALAALKWGCALETQVCLGT